MNVLLFRVISSSLFSIPTLVIEGVASSIAVGLVFALFFSIVVTSRFVLDDETLVDDLRRLATIVDLDEFAYSPHDTDDVRRYYAATTFRDYRLLEWFTGSDAMHTELESMSSTTAVPKHLRQLVYALKHLPPPSLSGAEPAKVLEVGFGKGTNTLFLAETLRSSGILFFGMDVVPEHVRHAEERARRASEERVVFRLGDATSVPSELRANAYDLVFGIESLCYLDTEDKREKFFEFAESRVRPGGRLVVVDGFRPDDFDAYTPDAKKAMELAESGMRIRRMPSMRDWKEVSVRHGFVVTDEVDLTTKALPFWTKGWRVGRALLVFALPLVSRYRASGRRRTETFANLVSVCTTAHAMRSGTARYGALVMEKE